MAADTTARDFDEHPIRLMTSLIDQKPLSPGEAVIKDKQWRAVLYDLDEEPSCRHEWIRQALGQIVHLIDSKDINSISISLPGVRYDCIGWRLSLELLLSELVAKPGMKPLKIWLMIPQDMMAPVTRELAKQCPADR